jgi:Arc/MetJ-type ribon-helix-helix transcriptional regulator
MSRTAVDSHIQETYNISMSSKIINLSLPADLVKKLDEAAKANFASRSDYIRESIVMRLKGQRIVDEWGEDGNWETVVDFREINPNGVPMKEVLAALKRLEKRDRQDREAARKNDSRTA